MRRLIVLTVAIALAAIVPIPRLTRAQNTSFQYKFPWPPTTSAIVRTLPYQGVHGCPGECVAAYDLQISSKEVVSSAQGLVGATFGGLLPYQCGDNLGYGNYVDVSGVRYAHLAAIAGGVSGGTALLQGDAIGTQGQTGHVIPCPQLGHLHWEFLGGASSLPAIIDGTAASSLAVDQPAPPSTNSVIGASSTAGGTLHQYYASHGGWGNIGWTVNLGNGSYMFPNRSWGQMQDFQHDPDFLGGINNTIHVADWNRSQAYLVDSVFWQAWAGGVRLPSGGISPLGMAVQERGACPSGSNPSCIAYQEFQNGYVWMNNVSGRAAVLCPSLIFDGQDGFGGLLFFASHYGTDPSSPNWNARADLNGDGFVGFADLLILAFAYNSDCHP